MPQHQTAPQFKVVRDFEAAIAKYTGAPSVVTTNSCTAALRLCLDWWFERSMQQPFDAKIVLPNRTYVSVPMQAIKAGFKIGFSDYEWQKIGAYRLSPTYIWDAARLFDTGMFTRFNGLVPRPAGAPLMVCVSFHATKTLGIDQGGAILHNGGHAVDDWLRCMRCDGRWEGQPIDAKHIRQFGHHCYMSPAVAATGLVKLAALPAYNPPLPEPNYPDLSEIAIFKEDYIHVD